MRLLAVFLVVSIIVHIGILLMPAPKKNIKKQEIIPVSFIDIKKENIAKKEIKPKTKQKQANKQLNEKQKKNEEKQNNKKVKNIDKKTEVKKENNNKNNTNTKNNINKNIDKKPLNTATAPEPLVLPDINVPLNITETIPDIVVPDIPKIATEQQVNKQEKNIDVAKELSSIASNNKKGNDNIINEISKEVASPINSEKKSNLYNFDISPSGDRKVVYLPRAPEFSLSNDTKVTIKFNIDKSGNTYNITFISRSSTNVEKLAYDYVNKMKFDAIIEDREDFAQITILFKVQK